jgi:GNAT superfamily N-acetyltransferase
VSAQWQLWDRCQVEVRLVEVRTRTDADLDGCIRLAEIVHVNDGYPVYLPGDLRSFLVRPAAIASWVADREGDIVGHVALHSSSSDGVIALAVEKTGVAPSQLGVVARLLVAPGVRRLGVGRSLLYAAAGHAARMGLWPILDVVTHHEGAIRLYDTCGWVRVGMVTSTFGEGLSVDEFVYLGPRPPLG